MGLGTRRRFWTRLHALAVVVVDRTQDRGDRLTAHGGQGPQRNRRSDAARRSLVANRLDQELLAGETYDVVLADYRLDAVEGFAPYWQDQLFRRLRPLIARRLYVLGLEPYVPHVPTDPGRRLVNEIGRLRDRALAFVSREGGLRHGHDYIIFAEPM